jgi:hypothetical protein
MGCFKKLSLLAEEGDKKAMALAAEACRDTDPRTAMLLYEKAGRHKEAGELRAFLEDYGEDLFGSTTPT